jgi:shikimate kinase
VRKCQFRKTASPNEFAEMYLPQHSHTPQETHSYEDVIILSLGGGTVMTQECAEMVQENSVCVYLRASVDTLVRNLQGEAEGRPMLSGGEDLRTRIEELMTLRSATYENVAHEIIDTDGLTVDQIADRIYKSIAD